MHTFEFILILLACVIVSAVLDQVLKRLALPLVQVVIGFVVALILPQVAGVQVDPELFLVLFIAPLLFNEARESTKADLWKSKGSILSMAIGLVLLTVLVVGFALHWLVPSIPLAAAFACAGALGPTDAAAVGALGSTVSLSRRQKTLLSGEALINDASGVVSFQFALAAALTGTFSAVDAGVSFLILFVGGILAGLVMGIIATLSIVILRRHGFENTVVHVLYEVFTPFVVFLAAEALGVSGILAVVAAGLVMAQSKLSLVSAEVARQQVLSNGVWEVLVFLINGILFVLLGMQLIQAMSPTLNSEFGLPQLLGVICVMTALVILVRFVWVSVIELVHRDEETGQRGTEHVGKTLKDALVTTVAGPKGAVTLSIIFTLPLTMPDGTTPFPNRDLIIFLTAGTILLTLIVANIALPLLSDKGNVEEEERQLHVAMIAVLDATLKRLRGILTEDEHAEYVPALRLVTARYRSRLFRETFELEGSGDIARELMDEVLDLQQKRADEIQKDGKTELDPAHAAPYYAMLRGIRQSVGYYDKGARVGSRFKNLRGQLAMAWQRVFPTRVEDENTERIYYDTCLFAIDLERVAIDYLEGVASEDDGVRSEVAQVLANEHQSVSESLWGRINYGQDVQQDTDREIVHGARDANSANMRQNFGEQFRQARKHADEADSRALSIELDEIRRLRDEGTITKQQAHVLRENVYLMQMTLGE